MLEVLIEENKEAMRIHQEVMERILKSLEENKKED